MYEVSSNVIASSLILFIDQSTQLKHKKAVLTHPRSRGYKLQSKILQMVQMLLEKAQHQDFPIPIWKNWSGKKKIE